MDAIWIVLTTLMCSVSPGFGIRCFVGNNTMVTRENIIDCSTLGIQREELYCRNESVYDTGYGEKRLTEAHRKCVAMSWYGVGWEDIGCREIPSKEGTAGSRIRCTCAHDLCNAPVDLASIGGTPTSGGGCHPPTHLNYEVVIYTILCAAINVNCLLSSRFIHH